MTEVDKNEGIIVSKGNVNAEVLAAGRNARATKNVQSLDRVQKSHTIDWTKGIVAVLGARNQPVGTGFVFSEKGLFLTCDHVLEDAGWPAKNWETPVRIQFKVSGDWAEALVVPDYYRPKIEGDIAVLKLTDGLPPSVTPLLLSAAQDRDDHEVKTWGYPEGYKDGLAGAGKVRTLIKLGEHRRLQLWSEETTEGYSGGPVWDTEIERVIGMVLSGRVADRKGRHAHTWFAIPAEALVDVCNRIMLT